MIRVQILPSGSEILCVYERGETFRFEGTTYKVIDDNLIRNPHIERFLNDIHRAAEMQSPYEIADLVEILSRLRDDVHMDRLEVRTERRPILFADVIHYKFIKPLREKVAMRVATLQVERLVTQGHHTDPGMMTGADYHRMMQDRMTQPSHHSIVAQARQKGRNHMNSMERIWREAMSSIIPGDGIMAQIHQTGPMPFEGAPSTDEDYQKVEVIEVSITTHYDEPQIIQT